MFAKQDDYTKRWRIYTAPFTPAILDGKQPSFATKAQADAAIDAAEK